MANGILANAHSAGWVEALLLIAGELYLPFLIANAKAFANGLKRLEIKVWDLPYALAPFKYQVKCLQQLRGKFAALDAKGSRRVAALSWYVPDVGNHSVRHSGS